MANILTTPEPSTNQAINVINNNPYKYNIGLFTADGRYQELKIGAINKLVLEDTFTNFYHKGYIVINNTFDAVERIADFTNQEKATTVNSNSFTPDKGFIFKGDARDMLIVDIMPVLEEDSKFAFDNDKDAEKAFKLSFVFSIYNTEEVQGTGPGQKFKKLYFWDIHYELLREKNAYYSTSNYVLLNDDIINSTDTARSVPTGYAIKTFLQEFFKDEDGWPVTVDEEEFEEGGADIFFSSPAGFKGIDCLQYLLSRHVSSSESNFDQAFLRIERNTSTFKFTSLKNIFLKALDSKESSPTPGIGDSYLETFKLGLYSDTNQEFQIEAVEFTPANALFLDKYGTVNSFSYDPLPGLYSQQNVVSVLVHNYEFFEKQFNIDMADHTIQSTLSVYDLNYVKPFDRVSYSGAYPNFFPGEYRTTQKNIKNIFSIIPDENARFAAGRNRALFNSVFLNNTVVFRVPGSTHRQAGSFIGINRDGAFAFSDFDSKLLGIYLILEVKHIFDGNEYFNEIRCIKTYSYDNLQLTTESR